VEDLEAFEHELHALLMEVEAEAVGEELDRFDVNIPVVMIDGVAHRRVLRSEQTYLTAAGPVCVTRTLYSTRQEGERAVCPLDLRAGIVEGLWTPLAAKQASWAVAHLTPQEAADLFAQVGNMRPSKSSLDRLPKQLSERWEQHRIEFESALRAEESIPADAVTVAVSIDGVQVPMKEGKRQEKRARAVAAGKLPKGPAGYQEAGCGTLSYYNEGGVRLGTLRFGRMPERKKKTLKKQLAAELQSAFDQRPGLRLVKLADGTRDNWDFLAKELPAGEQVVDFYHAAEKLHAAMVAAYGEGHPVGEAQFAALRLLLRDDDDGVEKVIRALRYQRDRYPRRRVISNALGYFRRHRRRMRYAHLTAQHLPIGSGVVEAACKTLFTQRLKRSGMRWSGDGGQAIATLRSLAQSNRFERGWRLLAKSYVHTVDLPANVVELRPCR
jgi:hypothetical protein